MTTEQFLAGLTGRGDDFRLAVEALRATGQPFCLIGGLAVNHYVEPVVTLDADFAIGAAGNVAEALRQRGFSVKDHLHSINAQLPGSRLRIQVTINSRYSAFPADAVEGELFGVRLPIAALDDLVQGKLWALAATRRASKKAKDKADLLIRICESHPCIIPVIPLGLISEVDALWLTWEHLDTIAPLHHSAVMRLTVNLEEDLYRMAKAYALSEDISISQAINKLLGRICRTSEQPNQAPNDTAFRRIDAKTGLPVVKCKRPFTTEDVYRLEDEEDLRHWSPRPTEHP